MPQAARTIPQAFRGAVAQFPDRTAVTAPDGDLTYRELDTRTDALAAELVRAGARRGSLVTLLTPRGTDLVVGMLGILKAGAAYLPIDPEYPPARIAWTLRDSGSPLAVVTPATAPLLPGAGRHPDVRAVTLDGPPAAPAGPAAPDPAGDGTDLAYVIYTSGSTGDPKGVQVEQHSVLRLFDVVREHLAFDEHDVWSMFHSAAFDFSVWEIWGPLLSGGRLLIVPREVARAPEAFRDLVRAQGVTVLSQTPSAFHGLMAADLRTAPDPGALRLVILGGEALDVAALRPWADRYGTDRPRLVNMYGITEATVHASCRPLDRTDLDRRGPSPIGAPLADLAFHLLGEDGTPPADGEPGELFIEGPGVARGYLGRPDLDAERFVAHVGADGVRRRRLRTGDRVVALPEGGYGYLGRVDDQLKIRGHRVEPGEIEAVLAGHDEVRRAVVVPHDHGDGDVRLIAYVQSAAAPESLAAELAKLAGELLPAHMCPSRYVTLAGLPLTANGKVDKDRLPAPPGAAGPAAAAGPTAGTAERISAIWRSVLDVPHVGADEDFFSLGGTSLSLVRMFARVNEEFDTDLDITVLIGGATVGALAPHVDAALAQRARHLTETP
ncbi:amino acid adenylation domain-containing protein [Streptomyces sp. NRRL B-3648]|uniref:amino acid adenylation domain-containing protein n=1 Tax=Streptomyces sp. NRRL B-3648 TaxID=1519493 RepID=UPI0006AEB4F5|nr:amino acid adenylation domain-containing protein [Streptomyces sp. NRRL B-3648]KOV93029.1 alanine-phosphoribitol ligase [Streptomyces sp. NRRL B-3648]